MLFRSGDIPTMRIKVVYYDLETTDLDYRFQNEGVQICNIAAFYENEYCMFEQFMLPTCPISVGASHLHALQVHNGRLFKHGGLVENACPMEEGLKNFVAFLEAVNRDEDIPVVLVRGQHAKVVSLLIKSIDILVFSEEG